MAKRRPQKICVTPGCMTPVLKFTLCMEHYAAKRGYDFDEKLLRRFRKAQQQAKRRDMRWCLDVSQYQFFVTQPCAYCDGRIEPESTGLDRIDNKRKIYSADNVLPCCSDCNMKRGVRWTPQEMRLAMQALKTG